MRGRLRGLSFLSKVEARSLVVYASRVRVGGVLTPIIQLFLPTQSHHSLDIFRVVILLGHKVLNIRLVGPNRHQLTLLIDFVVSIIMVCVRRGGTNVIDMIKLGISNEISPL